MRYTLVLILWLAVPIKSALNSSGLSLTPDEKKCWDDFEIFKNSTGKCKTCKPCGAGKGRNFTQIQRVTRDSNGDMRCPPCTRCPPGFYNNPERKGVKCEACTKQCDGLNRHVQQECTNFHEIMCGACLPGFYEQYHNIDYPCFKRKVTPDPQNQHTPSVAPEFDRRKNITGPDAHRGGLVSIGERTDDTKVIITIAGSAVIMIVICFSGMCIYYIRRPSTTRVYSLDSTGLENRNLTNDYDLETDSSVVESDQATRIANYTRQTSDDGKTGKRSRRTRRVSSGNYSLVRAELGRSLDTCGQSALSGISWHRYQRMGKNCKCCSMPCDCYRSLESGPARILNRSDLVFRSVANRVCHDPQNLFNGLGIPHCDIYQINNDRDRDPEKLSESEMVYKLLQKWVEKNPDEATLTRLCTELCKAGFHSITKEILRQHTTPFNGLIEA